MKQNRARAAEDQGQGTLGFSISEMTRVPESSWKPPDLSALPDRLAGVVGVDTETEDRGMVAGQGAGWAWHGGGRVIGYSVVADNCSVYLPIGHVEGNVDPDQARRWLNHVLGDTTQAKVFANAMYDLGWAETDGVVIRGPIIDIQLVEALLDEHRFGYSLEAIARDRGGRGKDEALLHGAALAYGVDAKAEMYKMPSRFAGPYATEDAQLPREIWAAQAPLIEAEGLGELCRIEHALFPMYMDMRRRGVRIDVPHIDRFRRDLARQVAELLAEVKRTTGLDVEPWEPQTLARLCDAEGVAYGRTPKSREPQITNILLERGTPATKLVAAAREKDKLRGTFIDGQILGQLHGDRVHGEIHPFKSEDDEGRSKGTVTGRLSMGRPNLQFIPVRTEEGNKIRRAFLPECGECWCKPDVSQQEVRLLVHFAVLASRSDTIPQWMRQRLASAVGAVDRYVADPDLNYHAFVATITGLDYKPAKILNLAIIYGRGVKETAGQLGKSIEETKALFNQHEQKMPFARAMSSATQNIVKSRGYLRSLAGRRARFPFYEPQDWDSRDGRMLKLDDARAAWPGQELTRARIHKSLNSLIQPSAADQTKLAMLAVWEAGLGRHVLVQVHDELDSSVPDERVGRQIADVMRDAVKLEVPVKVDVKFGVNWGDCE